MKKVSLIVVNGYPQSGKDMFVDFGIDELDENNSKYCHAVKYSTITTCMQAAYTFGWNGVKNEKYRAMLSDLKDLYTKYFDGTYKEMVDWIYGYNLGTKNTMLFAMIREPEEIRKIINYCSSHDIPNKTICIRSGRSEKNHSSHSDKFVNLYPYDIILDNDGTLVEWKEKSKTIIKKLYEEFYGENGKAD
jgi:hypothetical protein